MGLDVLDIIFRLEKSFGIKINHADFDSLFENRHRDEVTVRDLFLLVCRKLQVSDQPDPLRTPILWECRCLKCKHGLKGLRPHDLCPRCSYPIGGTPIWSRVVAVLSDGLGIEPVEVTPQASAPSSRPQLTRSMLLLFPTFSVSVFIRAPSVASFSV